MKRTFCLAGALALTLSHLPARAMAPDVVPDLHAVVPVDIGWEPKPVRYRPAPGTDAAPADPGVNGGYYVNSYGHGNYYGGPGGFAGYPAGSAGAQIYKQRQEWKCVQVPEKC